MVLRETRHMNGGGKICLGPLVQDAKHNLCIQREGLQPPDPKGCYPIFRVSLWVPQKQLVGCCVNQDAQFLMAILPDSLNLQLTAYSRREHSPGRTTPRTLGVRPSIAD